MLWNKIALCLLLPVAGYSQQATLDRILEQLNQLQQENQRLNRELDTVRQQVLELKSVKAPAPDAATNEKLEVVSQRVEDLDSTKVEADQRFPLRISGLVLMNSYYYAGH